MFSLIKKNVLRQVNVVTDTGSTVEEKMAKYYHLVIKAIIHLWLEHCDIT